ncbi:hypothetical protein [Tautonia sociabilis]|uniref:Uncharacterized protein n=1 Tax=Tautonia sociabilis TaxID=2080755 RepID=A0A432MMD9_9BACT|nr:hypothetical protein [Tautonia sociabilis]RUL88347.1 hypothetical protein TsocGM_07415 [Tautonia sociabilis]
MSPPPIRYPLPTLALLVLLAVLSWWGRDWLSAAGAAVRSGIDRIASGPPVPSSSDPMQGDGGIVRKVLLLRDGVEATDRPDGTTVETIGRRIFADVYDVWPLTGEPTHYRIGNRRPIGWVPAEEVLPWDTRIVLIPEPGRIALADEPGGSDRALVEVDGTPLPVVDWRGGDLRIVAWELGKGWERVSRSGWVRVGQVNGTLGALVSRTELLELLRRSLDVSPAEARALRVLTLLGRMAPGESIRAEQVEEVERALSGGGELGGSPSIDREALSDRLGRLNDEWEADATWSGIEYRAIPLNDLSG